MCRTTRSTARGSRTCSTGSPRSSKVTGAIGWEPTRALDEILADVIEHTRSAPALVTA